MTLRLHELHPSLVHFPLALFPAALTFDAAGWLSGKPALCAAGRLLMPATALTAGAAGLAGLVAQEAVHARGEAHDLLVTHRNLNAGLIALTATLAALRLRRERPSAAYLVAGLMGLGVMSYTAYLGGKLVYSKGVGVEPADGVRAERAPELRHGELGPAAKMATSHLAHAVKHAARHVAQGEIAPTLHR